MITDMPVSRERRTHSGSGTQDGAQIDMGSGLGAGAYPGLLGEERRAFVMGFGQWDKGLERISYRA